MTKFILHGGFTRDWNDLNRGFYAEISKDVPSGGTILLCYFSRKDKEVNALFQRDKERIMKETSKKSLNIALAQREFFPEQLKDADALFLQGGDTPRLMDALKTYPNFVGTITNKTVAGSSAGAQVLATYYHSSTYGGVHKGLSILPIRLIPHYQSSGFEKKDDPMALIEQYPRDLDLVVLKDYEWKILNV